MFIYHWTGQGKVLMAEVKEYIYLYDLESDFIGDYETEEKAIEGHTAPGFKFERKYDTDVDSDFQGLPLGRELVPYD